MHEALADDSGNRLTTPKRGPNASASRTRSKAASFGPRRIESESLKAEIVRLEQQAEQAKAARAVGGAEGWGSEEGPRRKREATIALASLELTSDQRALVAPIEAELRRIGCYPGVNQDWDSPAVRLGIAEYARNAKLLAAPTLPDAALLDT